jgi:hypothetical protein
VVNTELTVGQLRRILRSAPDDATIAEGLEELATAERREAADMAHGVRLTAYNEYIAHRRERESEHVQQAADNAKQAAVAAGPISRDRAYMVYKEAADLERLRFEVREPHLEFQEWIDAGEPAVHQIRGLRDLQAHGLAAGATS